MQLVADIARYEQGDERADGGAAEPCGHLNQALVHHTRIEAVVVLLVDNDHDAVQVCVDLTAVVSTAVDLAAVVDLAVIGASSIICEAGHTCSPRESARRPCSEPAPWRWWLRRPSPRRRRLLHPPPPIVPVRRPRRPTRTPRPQAMATDTARSAAGTPTPRCRPGSGPTTAPRGPRHWPSAAESTASASPAAPPRSTWSSTAPSGAPREPTPTAISRLAPTPSEAGSNYRACSRVSAPAASSGPGS